MRAVIVVKLPDLPDEVNGQLTELMQRVGRAVGALDIDGAQMIVAIREAADAVLEAAGPAAYGSGGFLPRGRGKARNDTDKPENVEEP